MIPKTHVKVKKSTCGLTSSPENIVQTNPTHSEYFL